MLLIAVNETITLSLGEALVKKPHCNLKWG